MEDQQHRDTQAVTSDGAERRFAREGRIPLEGFSEGANTSTAGATSLEDGSLGCIPGIERRLRVFLQAAARPDTASSTRSMDEDDLPDEAYEFTAEDYARVMASKKPEEIHLKTKKIRDKEQENKLKNLKKVVIRVQFPDAMVVEAIFDPEERLSDVKDLVQKCILHSDVPFHLYTTPPKQVFKDFTKTVYQAGLAPGATIFFAHQPPAGVTAEGRLTLTKGPFLRSEVLALSGLDIPPPSAEMLVREVPAPEPVKVETPAAIPSSSGSADASASSSKRPGKQPKWFKRS